MAAATVDGAATEYLVRCEQQDVVDSFRIRDRSLIAIQVATLED